MDLSRNLARYQCIESLGICNFGVWLPFHRLSPPGGFLVSGIWSFLNLSCFAAHFCTIYTPQYHSFPQSLSLGFDFPILALPSGSHLKVDSTCHIGDPVVCIIATCRLHIRLKEAREALEHDAGTRPCSRLQPGDRKTKRPLTSRSCSQIRKWEVCPASST